MAANCARRALQFSSKTSISRCSSQPSPHFYSKASNLSGPFAPKPSTASRLSLPKLTNSRLPVELGAALSLMPLHSANASALFTSLLTLSNVNWGCLSEGFATPL